MNSKIRRELSLSDVSSKLSSYHMGNGLVVYYNDEAIAFIDKYRLVKYYSSVNKYDGKELYYIDKSVINIAETDDRSISTTQKDDKVFVFRPKYYYDSLNVCIVHHNGDMYNFVINDEKLNTLFYKTDEYTRIDITVNIVEKDENGKIIKGSLKDTEISNKYANILHDYLTYLSWNSKIIISKFDKQYGKLFITYSYVISFVNGFKFKENET